MKEDFFSQAIWDSPLTDPPSGIEWEHKNINTQRTGEAENTDEKIESAADYEIINGKVINPECAIVEVMRLADKFEFNDKPSCSTQTSQSELENGKYKLIITPYNGKLHLK